jgi:hypothetical protein
MYIKRYTIASLLFIAVVGLYVNSYVSQESIAIDLFGIPLPSLSVALWVVIPMLVLYLASVAHISFYSLMGSFKLRKYEKDYEKVVDAIVDAYLGKKNRDNVFKTPRYQLLGAVIDNATIFPNADLQVEDERINTVLKVIEDIKNGEVVDLKKYALAPSNPLVIQNERNRYKKGDINADDILSNATKYDDTLCKEAYVDICKTFPLTSIEKYKAYLTKDALFEILARVNAEENTLEISSEVLMSLLADLELNEADYVHISSILSTSMIPEQRIKLFEMLSAEKEEVMSAFLYTLFDLEMLAPADEILENSQPDEFLKFKSYRALKECNKHFNINLFV